MEMVRHDLHADKKNKSGFKQNIFIDLLHSVNNLHIKQSHSNYTNLYCFTQMFALVRHILKQFDGWFVYGKTPGRISLV